MFEGDDMGHSRHFDCNIRSQSEVIAIIDAAACILGDICCFLESPNLGILAQCFGGVIPRGYINRIVNRRNGEIYSCATQRWAAGYQPLLGREGSETEAVNTEPNALGMVRRESERGSRRNRSRTDRASSSEAGLREPTSCVFTRDVRVYKQIRPRSEDATSSEEEWPSPPPSVFARNINHGDEDNRIIAHADPAHTQPSIFSDDENLFDSMSESEIPHTSTDPPKADTWKSRPPSHKRRKRWEFGTPYRPRDRDVR